MITQAEEFLRMFLDSSGSVHTDWKFWMGLIGMVFQMVVKPTLRLVVDPNFKLGPNTKVALKWIEVVSFDLIALSLVQCHSEAGIWTFLLIALVHNTYWMLEIFCKAKPLDKFTAADVYEDLRRPGFMVATIFFGQSLLFVLYLVQLFHLVSKHALPNEGTIEGHYTYWFSGVVAIQMSAMFGRGVDSQLGKPFHGEIWGYLCMTSENLSLVNESNEQEISVRNCSFGIRMCMGFIINAVMRDVIAYTTPLILMVSAEDILDFIQNGLAIVFITTLDTTSEGGVYRIKKPYALLP